MSDRLPLSEYFWLDEFECSCCGGVYHLSGELLDGLDWLREQTGSRIKVNSGSRCVAYNTALYKAKGQEPTASAVHTKGWAADIVFLDCEIDEELKTLIRSRFDGIGWGDGWVHVDVRGGDQREWSY